jgi:hypothetical protein
MVKQEPLGTEYCMKCAIMKEKEFQLNKWEENLTKREAEMDKELEFRYKNKN